MSNNLDTIPIGSGKLFMTEKDSGTMEKLKTDKGLLSLIPDIEKRENQAGQVSSGASLEYKASSYTAEDDLGYVKRTIITKEESKLKTGLCTWNAETLETMSPTARISKDLNHRILRVGGIGNDNGKEYIADFYHPDPVLGDTRIIICGKNEAGFTLKFAKDKETTIDQELKASVLDDVGTQIIYMEDIKKTTLHVNSKAGETTGNTIINVIEALGKDNSYVYKVAETIVIPTEGQDCSFMTTWDGEVEISAANENQVLIVEVDKDKKALKAGFTTVTSKTE